MRVLPEPAAASMDPMSPRVKVASAATLVKKRAMDRVMREREKSGNIQNGRSEGRLVVSGAGQIKCFVSV